MNTANPQNHNVLMEKMLHCSRYAKHALDTDAQLQDWILNNHATPCDRDDIQSHLMQSEGDLNNEADLTRALRRLRKRIMLKLIFRDINGLADLSEVMHAMTALAEICVQQAQRCLMQTLSEQFGQPRSDTDGKSQEMLVIGMGKLGGGELNVSSDIDLIFVYADDGETDGQRKISNHEFFTKLGRRLISMINETTADGYVFRVDMRLRPYGDSGPLVMSFAALEEYLVSQGREWERYAWIKARVIAPAIHPTIAELTRLAQPFIFRKYLDFGAIDSMRKLHAQIRLEVQRRDRQNNIKLGPGGIREIEFTAQVFQLIRGGRDARLRIRPTQQVLRILAENEQLNNQVATELDAAYVFLRNLEHRLQYMDDQQTQELPERPEDEVVLAKAMGYEDYAAMLEQLNQHRKIVSKQFELIFGEQSEEEPATLSWREGIAVDELATNLGNNNFQDPLESAQRLMQLRDSNRYRQLPELSRQRLEKLIPKFITLSSRQSHPDVTLSRLLSLVEGISRRAVYLAFLAEYPHALDRLVKLLSASAWASEYLTQHPALFDELLDTREIYQSPDWSHLEQELQTLLDDCSGDTERQMDILRHAQQEQTFHLLAMDLQDLLPLETLSDHLSDLADLLLRQVLKLSWSTARKRHCDIPKFAIIAYGKLGGRELGYASDLDLIFLYDDDHPDAQDNYARLGQRINTMLSSYTSSGRLYETDLRLRPNGASGLLVSSVEAFAEYQQDQAWVWEHQALTRARFSAGDESIRERFEAIRQQVLCKKRDLPELRQSILDMRKKMHDGHPNNSGMFDIKHDSGGMVDIEFMVQYLVLAYAHQHPQLTGNIGNLALLKLAAQLGLITDELAEKTSETYRILRQMQHRMRLNNHSPCRIAYNEIDTTACLALWKTLLEQKPAG